LPRRHWIFPGHTVDVTTVEGVERDLEACRLGRWVLVGDVGMDSKENALCTTDQDRQADEQCRQDDGR